LALSGTPQLANGFAPSAVGLPITAMCSQRVQNWTNPIAKFPPWKCLSLRRANNHHSKFQSDLGLAFITGNNEPTTASLGFHMTPKNFRRWDMANILRRAWLDDDGQDIAEYAVMLAVILVIVVGSIRLIGSNANKVFSAVSSSLQ
jgi:Flp pilus assembly pilin Flp